MGPLLKTSFPNFYIDLKKTSGKKLSFASVGITRFALMFRKASNPDFPSNRCYKVVASRHREIPFLKNTCRQHLRGFDALAKTFGRTAIPFWLNKSSQLQKLGADSLETAGRENPEVVDDRKKNPGQLQKV